MEIEEQASDCINPLKESDDEECEDSPRSSDEVLNQLLVVGKHPASCLDKMMTSSPSFCAGPLEALKRCVHEGAKVRVLIRSANGIRGTCTGFVVAFDKFWNLVMADVDEMFQKRKGKEPAFRRAHRVYTGRGVYQKPNEIVEFILVPKSGGTTTRLMPAPENMKRTFTGLDVAVYDKPSSQSMNAVEVFDEKEEDAYLEQAAKDDDFFVQKGKIGGARAITVTEEFYEKNKKNKDWSQWAAIKLFKRHMEKVFIRGDNIVLINALY